MHTNCRREVERTFGTLKGGWAFCVKNIFWGSPKLNKDAHLVCCGLRNYVENRGIAYVVQPVANVAQAQALAQALDGNLNAQGEALRQFLTSYCN